MFFQIGGIRERFSCTLIGVDDGRLLILKPPPVPALFGRIQKGMPVTVRYISLGTAWGFHSKIAATTVRPMRLVFLPYPEHVEHLNLRKDSRVRCYIPAHLVRGPESLKGILMDISSGGVRFVSRLSKDQEEPSLAVEDLWEVRFPMLGVDGVQRFRARVSNATQDDGLLTAGLRFEQLDPAVGERIATYCRLVSDYGEVGAS
jgi:c-di-GMP-binding flagellar brake protein YcgR